MGLTVSETQAAGFRAAEKNCGSIFFAELPEKLREMEEQDIISFTTNVERAKYLVGMAKKVKSKVHDMGLLAIPIVGGPPFRDGEQPEMRFSLAEAEAILSGQR